MLRNMLACATVLALSQATAAKQESWPLLREFEVSFGIKLDYRQIDVDIPFFDDQGAVRYRLICRGGDDKYLQALSERLGVASYRNDLGCILNVGNREADASLLSEDQSGARFSRGFFDQDELLGACATYPEFGDTRHFRLRGFELTIALTDKVIDPHFDGQIDLTRWVDNGETRPVKYAIMKVAVRRDPRARTAKAEQPGYLDPKGDQKACKTVKHGDEPRMCRNPGSLSWEQCPPGWEYRRYPWEQLGPTPAP